jgi:chaperonin GroES
MFQGGISMNVRPLQDRLLVKRSDSEEKTQGGLYIPSSAKERPMEGVVIAAGPGKTNDKGELIAMQVKTGDRVLFAKYSGTEIKVDGEEHLILREDDILGIVE